MEPQLKVVEILDVTSGKCAARCYPHIEKSLNRQFFQIWFGQDLVYTK